MESLKNQITQLVKQYGLQLDWDILNDTTEDVLIQVLHILKRAYVRDDYFKQRYELMIERDELLAKGDTLGALSKQYTIEGKS